MATSVLNRPAQQSSDITAHRLLVTRRFPDGQLYRPVGFLTSDAGKYNFAYLRRSVEADWFAPLPGLSDSRRLYTSDQLFPIFAERVISARRPDRTEALKALGLSEDAAPFEVLNRSGGQRVGDTIELVPMPWVATDGSFSQLFLVHGVRHRSAEAQVRIAQLKPRDPLVLRPDSANAVNALAIQVADQDGLTLGFVPDPLAEFMQDVLADSRGYKLSVEQANGVEAGYHFRLLVRLEGFVGPGSQPYTGAEWQTVA
jgi:hypothetical protein